MLGRMAGWKTTPRIDEGLCRRILELKQSGSQVRGLKAFYVVMQSCWQGQVSDDRIPRGAKANLRLLNESRVNARRSLAATVASLRAAGHDPKALFESLGLVPPTALAALPHHRLSAELRRLFASLGRQPKLRKHVALNLRFHADRIADRAKYIDVLKARMAAAPAKARARVKKFEAARTKFRAAADAVGLKVRGL